MDNKSASTAFPYLRSCTAECDTPIEGETKGEIPKWLKGCLIRVGCGLLQVGPDRYNHVFDGLALLHKFSFRDGKVTYQNRFLRSDTYRRNMKANRIVVDEFATRAVPDPCKTIFQRFASLFSLEEMTDNDLVNIILYGDEAYACSETNCIWRIDPETLDSVQKVKLNQYVPVNAAIAHAHEDTDGTVYNVGSRFGLKASYDILKFPPKKNKSDNPFKNGTVVCKIPASRFFNCSYYHSFGMTDNYFVFVEQPLYMNVLKVAWIHFFSSGSFIDAMCWNETDPTRFHIVRRSDGHLLDTIYVAKSFFVFHHINTYEEDGHIVVDMCTYDKGEVVNAMYVKALEELFLNPEAITNKCASKAKRFVLPLRLEDEKQEDETNLISLSKTNATARRLKDGSIFCTPESLINTEQWLPELPRINYDTFNGKKYTYFYSIASDSNMHITSLLKVDTDSKNAISWSEDGTIPSEPVFIAVPDSISDKEDTGVLLASLLYKDDETKVSLLVLNAETMKEVGRVTFSAKSSVPGDFHGTFIRNV